MERNARAGTPYELTPDNSRLSKAGRNRDELGVGPRTFVSTALLSRSHWIQVIVTTVPARMCIVQRVFYITYA